MTTYSTAIKIAKYYLSKEAMTPKKIQKIVYYAYSWTLTILNESKDDLGNKLFDEPIEAWIHGPVVSSVYSEYREYGWNEVEQCDETMLELPSDVIAVLDEVWKVYKDYTANELESITHQEKPWLTAREGLATIDASRNRISDEVIYDYYTEVYNS